MSEADLKACKKCGCLKPFDEFYRAKKTADRRHPWCIPCSREIGRKYYQDNKERENARSRAWSKSNLSKCAASMRRQRQARQDHFNNYQREYRASNKDSVQQWESNKHAKRRGSRNINGLPYGSWPKLKELSNYMCAYCGSSEKLTVDHQVPIARGGQHVVDNIVPACLSCNCAKGALSLEVFIERQGPRAEHYHASFDRFSRERFKTFQEQRGDWLGRKVYNQSKRTSSTG